MSGQFQALKDALTGATEGRRPGWPELVRRANLLDIREVLKDHFDTHVPAVSEGQSWKTYCPFAFEHHDGGLDKGFRVYETNTAYCFVMHGWLTPVRLMEIRHDEKPWTAARRLLEAYGISTHQNYREKYRDLVLEREMRTQTLGSPAYAAQALATALERVSGYRSHQFDAQVTEAMAQALDELDELLASRGTTDDDLRRWLRESTERVSRTLPTEQENQDAQA